MRFSFPKIHGRSYAYRSTAETSAPEPVPAMAQPLPPAGAQLNYISNPGSRRVIGGIEGPNTDDRGYLGRTEDDLNSGPLPNRINRTAMGTDRGKIGPGAGPTGVSGWPYDGNALFIPHQVIPRKPITVTAFQRTIDTSVTVPAIQVGGSL